jgi:hypothetical protein
MELARAPRRQTAQGLVDEGAVRRALALVQPLLEQVLADSALNGSGVLHVVVMNPALTPADASFEDAILYEASFGRARSTWDADYAGFARAKARLSWRTGMSSRALQLEQPQRLQSGDTTLWGSVAVDGIVVGISGAEAEYDEALAGAVALLLRAQARTARAAVSGLQL